jgi:Family of unknown function (DUF5317)
MKLIALALVLGVVAGSLRGGRLSRLSELRVRYAPLALLGLLLQLVNPPGRWPLVMLISSFVLLVVFIVANLRITGFALLLIGVSMNFAVIFVNGGMPVSRAAVIASGQTDTLEGLAQHRGVKHHLASSDDRLLFLGDVIAIPQPVAQVISIGDVFTYAGVSVVIAAAMRRRERSSELGSVQGAPGVHV